MHFTIAYKSELRTYIDQKFLSNDVHICVRGHGCMVAIVHYHESQLKKNIRLWVALTSLSSPSPPSFTAKGTIVDVNYTVKVRILFNFTRER